MRFIILALFCFFIAVQSVSAKGIESAEAHRLYEKAFQAAASVDDESQKNLQLTDLATEQLSLYDSVDYAKRILTKINHPIFKSEVLAKIAKTQASGGDCGDALSNLKDAYNPELQTDLSNKQPHFRSEIALRAIVEGYAYCSQVSKAEEIILKHQPDRLKVKQYLANAYSSIAAIRYILKDEKTAREYFSKAMQIALPIENETHRSNALSNIAKNQIEAGLYDDAFQTALEITQTDKPAVGMAARFSDFKNSVLVKIACRYASEGDFEKADRVLINQSVLGGNLYPSCFMDAYLDKISQLEPEKALKNLKIRRNSLIRHDSDTQLLKVALAYDSFDEKEQAKTILERLYKKYSEQYQEEASDGKNPSSSITWTIDDILQAYLIVSGDYALPFQAITSKPFDEFKPYQFKKTWGALIGLATTSDNQQLLTSVKEHLGEDFTNSSIQFGSFLYFLKKKQYENAEKAIEEMTIPERQGTYSLLAREKSGIADWDYLDKNPKF